MEEEKGKESENDMEYEKDENIGDEDEGGKSENPHSNPMGSDNRNVALNSKEDDNPNSVVTEQGRDSMNTILNTARNYALETFNFQKWVVDNITSMQSKQRELDNKINKLIKDAGKKNDEMETSEAEEEIEMEDWLEKDLIKGDLKHLEDVIRTLKE